MSLHKTTYLKDYKPSRYLIDTVDLTIELGEEVTYVTSMLSVRANSKAEKTVNQLYLNGENQKLLSIKLNDTMLHASQYELQEQGLLILDVPAQFTLEIKTEINPKANKELTGLYLSNQIFCTQCESEGFRRITYFIDRPDVLSRYTTTIIADKAKYPVLLSNGNMIDSGDLSDGLHWVKWEDPFLKPCYLFAMVAGNLDFLEDYFQTSSGREVTLRIFCEPGDREQCRYAMGSLKKAMKWDEEQYGREYDLNLFMIVAVHDFNFGAMENEGLNIFNAKYILADPQVATDIDYQNIDMVVGHEYFHNWSGNRVTCRDWFQICLKEGFTVFRDQCFVEDIASKAVHRIDEVEYLQEMQFPEDAGPLAHPIRPESYIEINNFYTTTVYRKGAEVIRMLQTILGKKGFRKGADLYFKRHDGEAVTCEDFIAAMEDANHVSLEQFRLWYRQAGTPTLYLASKYYPDKKEWCLAYSQACPATPSQPEKLAMQIPLNMALFYPDGSHVALQLKNEKEVIEIERVMNIDKEEGVLIFVNVDQKPIPSFLRGFSAPVKLEYQYRDTELAFLMENDSDSYMRFYAAQEYTCRALLALIAQEREGKSLSVSSDYLSAHQAVLDDVVLDQALLSKMIELPSERLFALKQVTIDVDRNHRALVYLRQFLAEQLEENFLQCYQRNCIDGPYQYHVIDSAKRRLKNTALRFLTSLGKKEYFELAYQQYQHADNMTDKLGVLAALNDHACDEREAVLQAFYEYYQDKPLVLDKWFSVQAASALPDTIKTVQALMTHEKFNIQNPNRVYALLVIFAKQNMVCFHDKSGSGYRLLEQAILKIDRFNSHVAARLVEPLTQWRSYDEDRAQLMIDSLNHMLQTDKLSKALFEIVSKSVDA